VTIDGRSSERALRPESVEELSHILATEPGTIVPIGSATRQEYGNPLRRLDYAIDTTALNGITEYVPADLTIHVQAGLRLQDLERTLSENNQFVPLDPFEGPASTIGGIAATNAQGPYRASGTIRDWIIGMKVVEANGTISKTGGRVVKNVTGYDLAKLYTGSIGTLAIIAEISLKVRATYGRTATAVATLNTIDDAKRLLTQIRTGPLQPVACEWIGPLNEVWLKFGEHPRAVEWQLKNLPPAEWRVLEGHDASDAWSGLRSKYVALGPIVLKVISLPSAVGGIIEEFQPKSWIAHAANGIVLMSVSDAAEIRRIRDKYRAVIERAPLEIRQMVPTFALNDDEYELMRKMKFAFDPDCRLNPGRHVDGER
jgi:glycolate oxidase FAD binding subunit